MSRARARHLSFGSLCSGAGLMDKGLEDAGLACSWQVELDKQARSVLAYHWPGVDRPFNDLREVDPERLAAVDLIAGGTPCQDLSVAGLRQGLDGERSGLFHHFVRVADSQPAAWILWENVDGALSSNEGRDFGVILRELSGFWPAVPANGWRSGGFCVGPKRWLAWRVLDSEYFGVPQRRYRVFIVGGPRGGRCCPEVLLEPDCLPGHPPPRREAGAGVAALLAGSSGGRGYRVGADEAAGGAIVAALTGSKGGADDNDAQGHRLVTAPLTSRPYADHEAHESKLVAHTLRGEGFDASEDGTGRGTPLVAVPYHLAQITHAENRANPQPGDPAPSLNGDSRLAVAFTCKQAGEDVSVEVAPTLRAMDFDRSHVNGGGQLAVYQCHGSNVGPIGTLREGNGGLTGGVPFVAQSVTASYAKTCDAAGSHGGGPVNVLANSRGVRRLTPRETERLQGVPDDFTRWGRDEKGAVFELKDAPRYRATGNGVTATVAAWIGRRIARALPPEKNLKIGA